MFLRSISLELIANYGNYDIPVIARDGGTVCALGDEGALRLRLPCSWFYFDIRIFLNLILQVEVFIPQALHLSKGLLELLPQPSVVLL